MNDLPYFTTIGAWGDVLACYVNICHLMELLNLPKANILHYGFDQTIQDFFKIQENVQDVIHIKPKSWKDYENIVADANTGDEHWVAKICDLPVKQVILGNLNQYVISKKVTNRKANCLVPKSEIDVPEKSILFNPYSFQSCSFQAHWRFMPELLNFLVRETDWHVVLTGQEKTYNINGEYWDFPLVVNHPRVTNLVGKTESMMEVLSVANECQGIISTSNCLALWSIITNKPAIILMNAKLTDPFVPGHVYWKDWIESDPNQIVHYNQTFERFKEIYQGWNTNLK